METKLCKDDAYNVLGIINSWINNIDTKASFAIAFAVFTLSPVIIITLIPALWHS
mgnify:CR=1 FL=1